MINYQDVLLQMPLLYGQLCSDEEVYRIANKLELQNIEKFCKNFLGEGEFHLEKVIIACCGSYLEVCGIDSVFVQNEILGAFAVSHILAAV